MDRRTFLLAAPSAVLLATAAPKALALGRKKGVMFMNRIGPSTAELFIANADGSGERKLLLDSVFDYHASFSGDGKWIVFTSEREGLGQADLYRVRADGSAMERLTSDPHVDDQGALSPDGSQLAFVSTRGSLRTNIWLLDIHSGKLRNLTDHPGIQGDLEKPDGFFRPSWSPDGQWIAFSSDRNSEWRGHNNTQGWEHTQALSIYVIRADGTGFRQIATKPDYCLGAPKWSPDGQRVVFYEITVEGTWGARRPDLMASTVSQIVSVDVATGARTEHTSGPGLKVYPQYLSAQDLAYYVKGGPDQHLAYTSGKASVPAALRSPTWSPDGTQVVYEKVSFKPRAEYLKLYSWDPDWDYVHMDVFPALSRKGELVITEKAAGSSIVIMNPDGSNRRRIFDTATSGLAPEMVSRGLAGAFQPAWSPDCEWIAFGLGQWFFTRSGPAKLMRIRRDGTGLEALTDGTTNAGYPSYSADGQRIVYRVWGKDALGLRILDLQGRTTQVLTTQLDNLPGWSPDGSKILFTRKVDDENYDVFTIKPDGTDLRRLTTHRANDGHAVWTADGRIMWSSGFYGFRDEAALYDNTFQPYGQIWIMNADGSAKRMLTDSPWEDSMPLYIPAKLYAPGK
jgi:Tol biopolymer transport system component